MSVKIRGKEYETVRERQARFYTDCPDGLICPELLNTENVQEEALFKVEIWKEKPDTIDVVPDGIGYAYENSQMGQASKTSWVENAETSAIGRALANMGYSNGSCSAEEMKKIGNASNNDTTKNSSTQTPKEDKKSQDNQSVGQQVYKKASNLFGDEELEAFVERLHTRFSVEADKKLAGTLSQAEWSEALELLNDKEFIAKIKNEEGAGQDDDQHL